MACSKLEEMAIYLVKQACGNDKLACVYKQVCQKPAHFLSAQMAILSSSFSVLIVLGIYNFVTIADLMETYTQSKEVGLV